MLLSDTAIWGRLIYRLEQHRNVLKDCCTGGAFDRESMLNLNVEPWNLQVSRPPLECGRPTSCLFAPPRSLEWSHGNFTKREIRVSMIFFFFWPKNSEENRDKQAAMLVTYRHTSYSYVVFSTPRIRLSLRGWFRYDKQWSKNWSQHFVSGYPSHHESVAGSPCWKPPTMELAGGPQGAWRYACYFVGFDRNCPNLTRTEGREERRYEEMMDDIHCMIVVQSYWRSSQPLWFALAWHNTAAKTSLCCPSWATFWRLGWVVCRVVRVMFSLGVLMAVL